MTSKTYQNCVKFRRRPFELSLFLLCLSFMERTGSRPLCASQSHTRILPLGKSVVAGSVRIWMGKRIITLGKPKVFSYEEEALGLLVSGGGRLEMKGDFALNMNNKRPPPVPLPKSHSVAAASSYSPSSNSPARRRRRHTRFVRFCKKKRFPKFQARYQF